MIQIKNVFGSLGIRIWMSFVICCLVLGIYLFKKSSVLRYPT